jgi:hypothetical protein
VPQNGHVTPTALTAIEDDAHIPSDKRFSSLVRARGPLLKARVEAARREHQLGVPEPTTS